MTINEEHQDDPVHGREEEATTEALAAADPADAPAIAESIADELSDVLENTDGESREATL